MDSLNEIADLINFDYSGDSRAEPFAIADDEQMVLFANIEESTNILILGDFS